MRRHLLLILTGFLLHTVTIEGSAFHLTEVATPDMGVAGVGNAAVARDAATAYFNPAAMMALGCNELLIGGQLFYANTHFKVSSCSPSSNDDNGGKPTRIMPAGGVYWMVSICRDLKFGFVFNSPFVTYLNYRRKWAGRFLSQKSAFYTFNLNPSLAYRINPQWSIGAGVSLQYGLLHERLALNPSIYKKPTVVTKEGSIRDKFDRGAWGYNFGILWEPSCYTRLGLAWRSHVCHDEFKGLPRYVPPEITPNNRVTPPNTTNKLTVVTDEELAQALIPIDGHMVMPAMVTLSGYNKITPCFSLLTQWGWTLWHQFRRKFVTSDNSGFVMRHRHWHDTFHAGIAAELIASETITLQGGLAVDSSPVKEKYQSADYPTYRQWRFGTGLLYNYNCCVRLGFAIEYLWMGHHPAIHNRFLNGHYHKNNTIFGNFTFQRIF